MHLKAFISYQTKQKEVAGSVYKLLAGLDVPAFLAHEHIEVSQEWRVKILEELRDSRLFIALLSAEYHQSPWCTQESGIAAALDLTCIPLSLDGAIPSGFLGHIQSEKVNPESITLETLLPGLINSGDIAAAIDILITHLSKSGTYREAESRFEMMSPYTEQLTNHQAVRLLEISTDNNQIHNAERCAIEFLPEIFEKHGQSLDQERRKILGGVLK